MAVFGLSVSYQVGGRDEPDAFKKMSLAFERAGRGFENFGEFVFPKLGPVIEAEVGEQFDAEGRGPNRGQWQDLSPAYEAQKERLFPGAPILVATGTLREALTEADSGGALRQASGTEFEFGTSGVPYASHHQSGTGRMPARPFFDFGEDFEDELRKVATDAARECVQKSGVLVFGDWSD